MKIRLALLSLLAGAGVLASVAIAKPPPGHGHHHSGTTTGTTTTATTATTTTSSSGGGHGNKVLICHRTGNGRYVLVLVSAHSALARGKHKGDVPAVNGTCPGPVQGHHGTTTAATTTT